MWCRISGNILVKGYSEGNEYTLLLFKTAKYCNKGTD